MFEMNVWPACLDCRWSEFEKTEAYGSKGTIYVFECKKCPVCKLIDGQKKFAAEREQ